MKIIIAIFVLFVLCSPFILMYGGYIMLRDKLDPQGAAVREADRIDRNRAQIESEVWKVLMVLAVLALYVSW